MSKKRLYTALQLQEDTGQGGEGCTKIETNGGTDKWKTAGDQEQ